MKPATRLNAIRDHLYGWSAVHPEWKVQFNSYAIVTNQGVALIDPLKLLKKPATKD